MLFLIIKTSIGFGGISLMNNSDCCSTEITMESSASKNCHDNKSEEKQGCCGDVCDCLCCGHIFTLTENVKILNQNILGINNGVVIYEEDYNFSFSEGIWQPPRLI